MAINKEEIKKKIYEKLPDLLPGLLKTVAVHIIMLIYHISMPPWVTLLKIKKRLKSHKSTDEQYAGEELERGRRRRRRRISRRF